MLWVKENQTRNIEEQFLEGKCTASAPNTPSKSNHEWTSSGSTRKICLCSIDYTKAFDRVWHVACVWKRSTRSQRHSLGPDSNNASWGRNQDIFFFQTSVMSVRHVCFPQTSSPPYSEVIMWNPEIYPGIKVGRHNIRTWYTGNTIAGNKQNLKKITRHCRSRKQRRKRWNWTEKKTKVIFVHRLAFFINRNKVEQGIKFNSKLWYFNINWWKKQHWNLIKYSACKMSSREWNRY